MGGLEIVVDGHWLSLESMPGSIVKTDVWPGGSEELSWVPGMLPTRRLTGGLDVKAYYGGACVWVGHLAEPDASQETLTAVGAWHEGDNPPALDGSGDATRVPDDALDAAIAGGLNWSRPDSIDSSTVAIDISQGPTELGTLLTTYTNNNTLRWGINTRREVVALPDDTTPTYQMLPQADGLGFALDNYASTLYGRYLDAATGDYATTSQTDGVAEAAHGPVAAVVDLTGRGAISTATANQILNSLLALGRATPTWTAPIVVSYGEIFNMGWTPIALEAVQTMGSVLRVHGGYDLAARLNGRMYLDVVIGQTQLADGLLTIQPVGFVGRKTLQDALTAAVNAAKKTT